MKRITRDRVLSDCELEQFIAAVRDRHHVHQPRDYAFFVLLANTGIRPSEALALTTDDIHLDRRVPWIRLHRRSRPHRPGPTNRLIINTKIAQIVWAYAQTLPAGARLFPWTKRQPARLFHYYERKAGVSPPRKVYALRHTVGMKLWRATRDLRIIQAIMGHARIKAAARYIHVRPDRILAAQEQLARI